MPPLCFNEEGAYSTETQRSMEDYGPAPVSEVAQLPHLPPSVDIVNDHLPVSATLGSVQYARHCNPSQSGAY
jgi:hypothetical protein